MLFWALKSQIWQKSYQKCTKNTLPNNLGHAEQPVGTTRAHDWGRGNDETFLKLVDQKSPFLSLENLLFLAPKTLKTTFIQKSYFYFESIIYLWDPCKMQNSSDLDPGALPKIPLRPSPRFFHGDSRFFFSGGHKCLWAWGWIIFKCIKTEFFVTLRMPFHGKNIT